MNQAKLYTRGNGLQRRDADAALTEFIPLMDWRTSGGELLLDVGCGPGDVTADVILPRVAKVVRKVIGADVSHAMVRHAGDRYGGGPLDFAHLDIADPHRKAKDVRQVLADFLVPQNESDSDWYSDSDDSDDESTDAQSIDGRIEEKEVRPPPLQPPTRRISRTRGFHKIFSFYCLHWVQDQRRALDTMKNLLAPGGEVLLVFLARSAVFSLYEKLAEYPRWKPYMEDYQQYTSPYHLSSDPADEFRDLLESVGFTVMHCSCRQRFFKFDSMQELMTSVMAVNPFVERIPKEMQQAYTEDCAYEICRLKLVDRVDPVDEDGPAISKYHILVVHAKKPPLENDSSMRQ